MPQRIASLLAGATEILYGLGLAPQVVAVSHECDYPADAAEKPRVTFSNLDAQAGSRGIDAQVRDMTGRGAALYGIDVDRLAELRPDLIVTQAQCDVCAVRYEDVMTMVRTHAAFSATQVVAINPQSLDDVFADVLRVGQAAGRLAAAEQYVTALQARVERVREITQRLSLPERPRVACIEWLDPLMLAGNWVPEMIEIAGGANGLTQPGRHSPYVEWERIRAYDPQVIVVTPCGFDLTRTLKEAVSLAKLSGWSHIAAVREGHVYAVDGNAYFNRSGPRLVESVEILSHLFHPNLFSPPLRSEDRFSAWRTIHMNGGALREGSICRL